MKTWIEISASAVKHNIETAWRVLKNGTRLCCVVKANAYGHGLLQMTKLAQEYGADWLAVDSAEEGIALRENGISLPVIVLGYIPIQSLEEAVRHDLSLTVYNQETIEKLPAGIKIHIKVETGTGRQGIFPDQLLTFSVQAQKKGLVIEGLSTHFANIEDTNDSSYAMAQLQKFNQARELLVQHGINPICHTACSAAIFLYSQTHFDMVRLGISLYGLWSSELVRQDLSLRVPLLAGRGNLVEDDQRLLRYARNDIELWPVLSWKTIVAQIKSFPEGAPIGYGLTERLKRPSRVAVLPIGYFDGFDRKLSKIGEVLIHGQRCKVLGRVCMNMVMVDVTDVSGVKIEDEVVLLGKQGSEEISAEEIAEKIGTINYEVVTRINPMIKRVILA